jgi:septal ring factor EnvC (AmiA/AmiB activator)
MRRLRTLVTLRVNRSIAWRVAEQLGPLRAELAKESRRLRDDVDRRLGELDRRLGSLDGRLGAVERRADWSANELARLAPQVAALETRVEQKARPTVLAGGLEDLPEARALVELVREEHARVRARLSLVSAYEERLRRIEERLLPREDAASRG